MISEQFDGTYARTLQLLGATLLFGRHDLAMRLAALQTAFDGEDGVYEALLSFIDPRRPAVDEWYFAEPYAALYDCLHADDPVQRLAHLRHYLANWHPALVREDWFNGHLRAQGLGGYYGLWAFERPPWQSGWDSIAARSRTGSCRHRPDYPVHF